MAQQSYSSTQVLYVLYVCMLMWKVILIFFFCHTSHRKIAKIDILNLCCHIGILFDVIICFSPLLAVSMRLSLSRCAVEIDIQQQMGSGRLCCGCQSISSFTDCTFPWAKTCLHLSFYSFYLFASSLGGALKMTTNCVEVLVCLYVRERERKGSVNKQRDVGVAMEI